MGLQYFTLVHILISLVGIVSGFGALSGLLAAKLFPRWTAFFLATTAATSVTGFFFPFRGITPGIVVGVLSLLALGGASYALYLRRLAGAWRKAFVICALIALYFNVFVLVAQLFRKTPALMDLAPTQTEPPFAITQAVVLVVFITLGVFAASRFCDRPVSERGVS
jgi:hypothetical protein